MEYEEPKTDAEILSLPEGDRHAAFKHRQIVKENNKRLNLEDGKDRLRRIQKLEDTRNAGGVNFYVCQGVGVLGCAASREVFTPNPQRGLVFKPNDLCSHCISEDYRRKERIRENLKKTGLPF